MADEDCGTFQFGCRTGEAVGDIIGDAIEDVGQSVWEGFEQVLVGMGTMWLNVETISPTQGEEHSPYEETIVSDNVQTVLDYMMWIGTATAVLALIGLGALVAIKMRSGEGIQAVGRIGLVLFAVVLMGGAGGMIGALGWEGDTSFVGSTRGTAGFVQQQLYWFVLAAAVAGVIFGSMKMIWEQRADPGKDVIKQVLTLVVVGAIGTTVMALLMAAADYTGDSIIDNAIGDGDFAESVMDMLFMVSIGTTPSFAVMLVIILGLLAILMSFVQMILMVARSGMLVLLAGVLPLAASFTNTEMGQNWFKKVIGWSIAFILYKPVAAIIYAAAFDLVGSGGGLFSPSSDDTDFLGMMAGFMMMILALFSLPALLRFVSPTMAAMGGGAMGGAAAGAAISALPTGAQAVGRLGGGGGSSSGGESGPSGSSGQSGSNGQSGSGGASGAQGSSGGSGDAGSNGASAASAGGSQGASGAGAGGGAGAAAGGAGASGSGAASGGGAAAASGGGAAAAGGPVGAGVAAGAQAAQKGKEAAQSVSDEAASNDDGSGGEQPSGSQQ